ncbi:putative serine/threonine/dual specificity protein kinase, catalytic domain-containing protein [Tanacetum coccineum]
MILNECASMFLGLQGSGYHQKDRKPSQNDKTEHGMEKTVQNQGQKVLCGRPAVDPTLDERGLVGWAKRNIKEGTLNDIIDLNMTSLTPCSRKKLQIIPDCLKAFVKIAVKCLQTRPKDRPTMSEVVVDLEAALALQERGEYLVRSYYNNGEQISSSSYRKTRKIMTLSRMLRKILPAKTPVRPDVKDGSPHGKKKNNKVLVIKEVIPSKRERVFPELRLWSEKISLHNLKVVSVTRNFSDDMVVGEGAFGKVFKVAEHCAVLSELTSAYTKKKDSGKSRTIQLIEMAEKLIKEGKAYINDTPSEQMQKELNLVYTLLSKRKLLWFVGEMERLMDGMMPISQLCKELSLVSSKEPNYLESTSLTVRILNSDYVNRWYPYNLDVEFNEDEEFVDVLNPNSKKEFAAVGDAIMRN